MAYSISWIIFRASFRYHEKHTGLALVTDLAALKYQVWEHRLRLSVLLNKIEGDLIKAGNRSRTSPAEYLAKALLIAIVAMALVARTAKQMEKSSDGIGPGYPRLGVW